MIIESGLERGLFSTLTTREAYRGTPPSLSGLLPKVLPLKVQPAKWRESGVQRGFKFQGTRG